MSNSIKILVLCKITILSYKTYHWLDNNSRYYIKQTVDKLFRGSDKKKIDDKKNYWEDKQQIKETVEEMNKQEKQFRGQMLDNMKIW